MFNLVPFSFNDWERKLIPDIFNDEFFYRGMTSFRTDISDTGKEYLIEAELPGFAKEEISVAVDNDRLTIIAQRNESNEEKRENYLRKERRTGQVMRSFILDGVNREEIKAEFKDGVLKLSLPKAEQLEAKTRQIEIN